MKIAILGFSREGVSTLRFLKKQKLVFGHAQKEIEYWILDKKTDIKTPPGVKTKTGKNYLATLEDFDLIIRSPGIPYNQKELTRARKKGVQFTSATRLFFDYCPAKIIGITGTKGKGTTATILYKILKAAKKDVFLVGNIGTPALDLLPKVKKGSVVIFELSSFQLQDLEKSPSIAIILGIAPDHLDSHKNFKEYVGAKSHIALFQKKSDWVFFDTKNKWARWIAKQSHGHQVGIDGQRSSLVSYSDLYIPAPHLVSNAALAAVVAKKVGCSSKIIREAIQGFKGYEHRLEYVLGEKGIDYYNDSGSTNPLSTIAAVRSFQKPITLIVGGKDKNINYSQMAVAIDHQPVQFIVIIGENKKKIAQKIKRTPFAFADSLKEAVKIARSKSNPGTVILFSPGSSSFDMFKNYDERGKIFKDLVRSST